jgi:flagellar biosynthesis/type III secretory pathway protein FliH
MYGAGAYAKAVQKYADQAAAEQKRLESETPQQKAAREARERAENAMHQRARNARIRNIDMDAYYQGRRTGNNIGLDDQLKGE